MGSGRYVLTGAPGSGKTVLGDALRERGHRVVAEAATDVIAGDHVRGVAEPWRSASFIEDITAVQAARQGPPGFYDRSPFCTLALARHLDRPVPANLAAEVARAGYYEPTVFFVEMFGFVTPTAARRISYADAVRFGEIHRDVYLEYGFALVNVPPAPVAERVALVESYL
jgi:predicted ATPase